MLADDIDDTSASNIDKRARFRNIIQLIQLTTTILNKGGGPILRSDEPVPNPYSSSRPSYTYLDAAVRLLVRKDEVIAAAQCTSFCKDSAEMELAIVAQSDNVPVVGMFTFCGDLLLRTISPRY
jgi:hypothetical protein